jgi:SAM-dependent methyltransferase
MFVDVVDLREFYASPLGRVVAHSMSGMVHTIWPGSHGENLVGLGFCVPWLDHYRSQGERVLAFMPAQQGALEWPQGEASLTALVMDEQLPLPDSSVDRLLMVHFLEHAQNPAETLSEAWRVLSPGGKILIIVPNRRGLWARMEHTPFGIGRPFSRSQLSKLLRDALLTPTQWSEGLHFPPFRRRSLARYRAAFEWLGRKLWPAFSGVIAVEATKRLYQGLPSPARARRRALVPVLAPQPSMSQSNRLKQDQ